MRILYKKFMIFCGITVLKICPFGFDALAGNIDLNEFNPIALYGGGIDFDVIRNGENIGVHSVRFTAEPEGLSVHCLVDMKINFLAIFNYRYRYESKSVWTGPEFKMLEATVNDDGTISSMLATRSGPDIHIRIQDRSYKTRGPIIPTDHWNSNVLLQTRVLNTLTGNVNNVGLVDKGSEKVSTEEGSISATRYTYTGDLVDTDVWYDNEGRWVKLRFLGSDGTPIEYVCRRCRGGQQGAQ